MRLALHNTASEGSIETLKELMRRQSGYTLVPELAVLDEVAANPLPARVPARLHAGKAGEKVRWR